MSIHLKHLRDFNNTLGLMSEQEHDDFLFSLNQDTLAHICDIHSLSKVEILNYLKNKDTAQQIQPMKSHEESKSSFALDSISE